jgi:ArsR family transcriptional regulator, arsenate/arsenite/antimonite-responsive transcriptional repressor
MNRQKSCECDAVALDSAPVACCSLDIEGEDKARLIAMFKALGNKVRFDIVQFLVTHPGCITGDIVSSLPLAQATVSQHLKVLRDSGWLEGEIEGPAVCYQLRKDNIVWLRETLKKIL